MAFVGRTDVKDPVAQQDQWERLAWDTHMCASFMVDALGLRQVDEIGPDNAVRIVGGNIKQFLGI